MDIKRYNSTKLRLSPPVIPHLPFLDLRVRAKPEVKVPNEALIPVSPLRGSLEETMITEDIRSLSEAGA